MRLIELDDYYQLYENIEIYELVASCMTFPTEGKVQNIAQSVYSKHQGHVYLAYEDKQLIGFIGIRMVDRKAEIFQLAVKKELQRKGKGSEMIDLLIQQIDRFADKIHVEVSPQMEDFFKKNNFIIHIESDGNPDFGLEKYIGVRAIH